MLGGPTRDRMRVYHTKQAKKVPPPGIFEHSGTPADIEKIVASIKQARDEVGPSGVYVQAVLPSATRTEIWSRSGRDVNAIQGVMEVDELVDAALVGFDRREAITIPPLCCPARSR